LLHAVGSKSLESEVEPLAPGDTDEVRVEHWENWERDGELGEVRYTGNGKDEMRQEFRRQLDWVGISTRMVKNYSGSRSFTNLVVHDDAMKFEPRNE
jgi:hypothetical protein